MSTFEQEADEVVTDLFPVYGKPTSSDGWALVGVFANEGLADLAAAAKVSNPDNWYKVQVCRPTGNLFKDTV